MRRLLMSGCLIDSSFWLLPDKRSTYTCAARPGVMTADQEAADIAGPGVVARVDEATARIGQVLR
jgi:hypothetical protein